MHTHNFKYITSLQQPLEVNSVFAFLSFFYCLLLCHSINLPTYIHLHPHTRHSYTHTHTHPHTHTHTHTTHTPTLTHTTHSQGCRASFLNNGNLNGSISPPSHPSMERQTKPNVISLEKNRHGFRVTEERMASAAGI